MRQVVRLIAASATALLMLSGQGLAAEADVRVFVPDVPNGVIVSNCYRAIGSVYGASTFEFCSSSAALIPCEARDCAATAG
jgi:hypothetical protein